VVDRRAADGGARAGMRRRGPAPGQRAGDLRGRDPEYLQDLPGIASTLRFGCNGIGFEKTNSLILAGRVAGELKSTKKIALAAAAIMAVASPIVVGVMNAPAMRGQPAPMPKFEVASIKPCRPDAPTGRSGGPGRGFSPGTLNLTCQTVERMIENAYDFLATGKPRFRGSPTPIESAPAWVSSERFTIEAKSESPQGRGMMQGPMMQGLLEDRFKLKLRRVPREVPVYVLTVSRGGPKLEPSKPGSCDPWDWDHPLPPTPAPGQAERYLCNMIMRGAPRGAAMAVVDERAVTMAGFAEGLSILLEREVVDRTGISGTFDIHVEFPVEELPAEWSDPRDPSAPRPRLDESPLAFAAVRRLGLKLESAKGTGETLVIDHVERPSEN
jgi:bla regulator protein blaR1